MVSNPSFDPDIFGGGVKAADWQKLMNDPDHPLQNRVIQGTYPPGSTFKIVDSIAGMQEHTLTPETTYSCNGGLWFGGRTYHCWRKHGHGAIQLHRAIVSSCDVFFYQVGEKLGIDKLSHWAHLLGLGERSGIALDNEKAGTMPSSAWKQKRFHERWYPAETLSVAIGQGYVTTTPLQMAQVAAIVANGGIRYRPQFVKEVEGLDGNPTKIYEPIIEDRIAFRSAKSSPKFATRCPMSSTASAAPGTRRKLDGIEVAGKSGTAQVVGNKAANLESGEDEDKIPYKYRDNGWFIAFAPKDHPQIAIACIIEHGGHGGSSAAPVIHDVMKRFFELYPPNPVNTPDLTNAMPDPEAVADARRTTDADGRSQAARPFRLDAVPERPRAGQHRSAQRDERVVREQSSCAQWLGDAATAVGLLSARMIMVGALFFDYRAMLTYAYPIYVGSLGAADRGLDDRAFDRRLAPLDQPWILSPRTLGTGKARDRAGDGALPARRAAARRMAPAPDDHPGP